MATEDAIAKADNWFTGEDKTFNFTIYQEDGVTPRNITGLTFHWEVRKFRDSPTTVLAKNSGTGITIFDGPTGRLDVAVARTDTQTFEPGTYYHELSRTTSGAYTVETFGSAVLQRGIR